MLGNGGDRDWINVGLALLFIMSLGVTAFGAMQPPVEYDYEYEVKTEQVQSDSHSIDSSNVVSYKNLTGAEKEAIYKAYRESDHFLGGSSVFIERDESLNLSEGPNWQVVEIEGVRLLVGIVLVDKTPISSDRSFGIVMGGLISALISMVALFGRLE